MVCVSLLQQDELHLLLCNRNSEAPEGKAQMVNASKSPWVGRASIAANTRLLVFVTGEHFNILEKIEIKLDFCAEDDDKSKRVVLNWSA